MGYSIKNLSDLDEESSRNMSRIFIESFGHMFEKFSKDKEALIECFEKSFIYDMIYVALDGKRVVGFIAVSNCKGRVVNVNKKEFCNHFGKIKGAIFSWQLKMIMGKPVVSEPNQCYIDFVAVDKDYRRKGVAIELFNYIHEHLIFDEFNLDVLTTNPEAQKLYEKLGYKVDKVKKSIMTRSQGLGNLVIMKHKIIL
ncbi:MAG: N-acetyltransferase [Clostridium sp.]|nr:N-acetyltransferase [Clostridium sp.]MDU7085473.1 N-acetyltransferase [Clostridium sp.]